jgi:hypothetical protein
MTRLPGVFHAIVGINEIGRRLQKMAALEMREGQA